MHRDHQIFVGEPDIEGAIAEALTLIEPLRADGSEDLAAQAERKAAQSKAAVYKYYFQWYSPVREGKLRSMHTMDIPFVFQNIGIARSTIGDGPERQPLADRMSAAWAAFARGGNPNHRGLSSWPAYTPSRKATMIFNNECKAYENPFWEERAAIGAVTVLPAGRA